MLRRILLSFALTALLFAQDSARPERKVSGQTVTSANDPAVSITFDKAFTYAGGQVIDIFHVAGAEQHFFIDAAPDKSVRRFYWVQFEHYYPDNNHTYDYSGLNPVAGGIDGHDFVSDTKTYENYFTQDKRAGSDSEAVVRFLLAKGYKVDGAFVRTRLFHLPDSSKRKELMIIYGERIEGLSSAPAGDANLRHAREFMKIRKN